MNGQKIYQCTLEQIKKQQFQTILVNQFLQRLYNFYRKDQYFFKQYCNLGHQKSKVPSLEDIMESYPTNKHMLIELKGQENEYPTKTQAYFEAELIDILCHYDFLKRNIVLESYNFKSLLRIKERIDIPIIGLINKSGNTRQIFTESYFNGFSLEFPIINPTILNYAICKDKDIYSWDDKRPVDHYYFIKKLLKEYQEIYNLFNSNLTVISEFPTKTKEYILTKKN